MAQPMLKEALTSTCDLGGENDSVERPKTDQVGALRRFLEQSPEFHFFHVSSILPFCFGTRPSIRNYTGIS